LNKEAGLTFLLLPFEFRQSCIMLHPAFSHLIFVAQSHVKWVTKWFKC